MVVGQAVDVIGLVEVLGWHVADSLSTVLVLGQAESLVEMLVHLVLLTLLLLLFSSLLLSPLPLPLLSFSPFSLCFFTLHFLLGKTFLFPNFCLTPHDSLGSLGSLQLPRSFPLQELLLVVVEEAGVGVGDGGHWA